MNRTLRTLTHAACVFLLVLSASPWAGTQDFTLLNRTGLRVVELYLSPTTTDDWEEDVLGVEVLEDGESVEVQFSPKERAAAWDLKIIDADGDEVTWTNLRLDRISKITLRYDKDGNPIADLE
jgi:hypothetical protein